LPTRHTTGTTIGSGGTYSEPVMYTDVLDEDGIPIQETLADVLGFKPQDEEKLQLL
jgi:hypothetical protein